MHSYLSRLYLVSWYLRQKQPTHLRLKIRNISQEKTTIENLQPRESKYYIK